MANAENTAADIWEPNMDVEIIMACNKAEDLSLFDTELNREVTESLVPGN